ncbi:MAG: GDSL-type esterase/lipase family protein, partial [Polyangiales bacterium]
AGAGSAYRSSGAGVPVDAGKLRRDLGRAVAAGLDELEGEGVPGQDAATSRSRPERGRRTATAPRDPGIEGAAGGGQAKPRPEHVHAAEYAHLEVEIEQPRPAVLAPFFAALRRTARAQDAHITRIAHYGDSSIATDLITHTMRRRLQRRFGDAGHGFVLTAKGYMPYRHRDVKHEASPHWSLRPIMKGSDKDGRYGYGGVLYRSRSGAWARFGPDPEAPVGQSVSRFIVFYERHPLGGGLRLKLDNGPVRLLATRATARVDAREVIDVPPGVHTLELRHAGGGTVHLYGVALERSGPGVVYDSLGLVGARARRLLNYNGGHIKAQLKARPVDLLILGFGGNEAGDPVSTVAHYEAIYRRVIRRMKAGRKDLPCLLFAPLDQARRDERGAIATMPSVPRIVAGQRAAARAEGCAFYDTFQAMGGKGAMRRWYRSHPRLAMGDFRHATPAGYGVIAQMFYKALLKAFAEDNARLSR